MKLIILSFLSFLIAGCAQVAGRSDCGTEEKRMKIIFATMSKPQIKSDPRLNIIDFYCKSGEIEFCNFESSSIVSFSTENRVTVYLHFADRSSVGSYAFCSYPRLDY